MIGEADAAPPEFLGEETVLLEPVADDALLVAIHPTGKDQEEEVGWGG